MLSLPFNPVRAPPIPYVCCASEASPFITSLAAGDFTPVLASSDDVLPFNNIVAGPGSQDVLRDALAVAGLGGYAFGKQGNPMTTGSLSMLGQAGPFLFTVPNKKLPAVHGLPDKGATAVLQNARRGPTTAVDRKGKEPMDCGPAQQAATQILAPNSRACPQVVLSDSDSLPDLNEPAPMSPAKKKTAATITYRRRSPRIQKLQDGMRMDSMERASLRKATVSGDSESSIGSTSSRRRKTRRIPDIKDVAPLPITSRPAEMNRQTLMDLAGCCGITMEMVDVAMKEQEAEVNSGKTVSHG
jgi:hypothetical protein